MAGVGRVTVSERRSTSPLAIAARPYASATYHARVTDLLDLAVRLAGQAGDLVLRSMADRSAGSEVKTSLTDHVTDVDRASEALIVEGIRRARPDDGIVGEEGADHTGTTGVRWVIDPLDGTTNYLYDHPAFAVSIGVEVDGAAEVGVVAAPAQGEVFSAARGGGAFRNGEPITVSGLDDLATALIATGFGYSGESRAAQGAVVARVLPHIRDIRRNGSAALDLCWVACGRLDGYYEAGLQHWDMAAGVLIAAEAGAVTTGLTGGPPRPGSVVAATPGVAPALLALLAEAGVADLLG